MTPNLPDLSKLPRKAIIIASGVIIAVLLFVVIRLNLREESDPSKNFNAEFSMWGVLPSGEVSQLLALYKEAQPGVKISYTQFDEENYERALVNALASGKGPSMFMINNRSLPKEMDKIVPAQAEQMPISRFRDTFPKIVEQDFVSGSQIFALPIYVDTLALIYNKNLLDQALIVRPPRTWDEFREVIPRLRSIDAAGRITKAGAAIGGSNKTINTAVDILNLLMLQNGTDLDGGSNAANALRGENGNPGLKAFEFYLQFANAGSPYYTWNDNQQNYIDSFINGRTALIFDYHDRLADIKNKSPFLEFGVSSMLQLSGAGSEVNYGNYWGIAVSRQLSPGLIPVAWDFIIRTTTDLNNMRNYTNASGRPPALRSLIGEKLSDPEIGVFTRQILTARSWKQPDEDEVQKIFSAGVSRVLTGQSLPAIAIDEISGQLSELAIREF